MILYLGFWELFLRIFSSPDLFAGLSLKNHFFMFSLGSSKFLDSVILRGKHVQALELSHKLCIWQVGSSVVGGSLRLPDWWRENPGRLSIQHRKGGWETVKYIYSTNFLLFTEGFMFLSSRGFKTVLEDRAQTKRASQTAVQVCGREVAELKALGPPWLEGLWSHGHR